MAKRNEQIRLEGVKLCCRNFAGTKFGNGSGRSFGVLIDMDLAQQLEKDGWTSVRYFPPYPDDPDDTPKPWLLVKFKYGVNKIGKKTGPNIVLINSRGKKKLDEETVDQLDWSLIKSCDIIAHPFAYPSMNGRNAGISTWLDALYVTVQEDEFEMKYSDLRDLDNDQEG